MIGPAEVLVKPDGEANGDMDDAVCYHEGGDIFPEDIENHMAVLPEVEATTREVTIGVAPHLREKLSMLIKGLLSATIITPSTSHWASPIVVIIKANGMDIRLCIDYQVVNSLTRLMVYPMLLINDLLDDLDKVFWYCSLDMASESWVVSMTPRARLISAFTTPFGLVEWTRMPFGLKNAPQIYQRIVDNVLYEHMRIKPDQDKAVDVRSYVDDILVTGDTWTACPKDLEAFSNLPFPTKLKSMQSFLGSLNYDIRFIEDFAVYGKEEILGAIAASITPRKEVDEALIAIAPKQLPRKMIAMITPTVEPKESLLVASFDGSARAKRAGGAYSAILWKLLEWTILEAMSEHMPDLTVNEAEYRGLLLCFDLLSTQPRGRVVICGGSNLVIR
ncbi:reverse transcriptase [Phytophthora megakarya]|uniref:Reverse transcriptase n=1 Tax=Phytophthora megakarya TaxID=4795 RepID=A0A225VA11_9STRA|nr:reverse transcriptase [Phytophthora megakarya]